MAGFLLLGTYAVQGQPLSQFPSPWTSVCFLAFGLAVWLRTRSGRTTTLPLVLASFVLALGMAFWGEYLLGLDFGIDRLLFPTLLPAASYPGRPGSMTSFNFILLGGSFLLFESRNKFSRLFGEACLVTSITLCVLSFVITVLGSSRGGAGEILFPSVAMLFVVAASGLLASDPNGHLMSLLRSPGPGGIFARWLLPVPLILPAVSALVRNTGRHFGFFNTPASAAIFSFADILLAILIVWGSSAQVARVDRLRRRAEQELRASRDELDERVNLRTRELLDANRHLEIQIAERQNAERELRQANAMLNRVIEASPFGICAFNSDGTVRTQNAVAESMHVAEDPVFLELFGRAMAGERIAGVEIALPDESQRPPFYTIWAASLNSIEGAINGVLMLVVDTSEQKAFEARVHQAQKLESIGLLAGGIAHDFNNILTGILGNASLLLEGLPPTHSNRASLEQIVASSQRAAGLTRQLLAYAGRGRFVVERISLSRLVGETSELIRSSMPKAVRLQLQVADNLPAIDADASQIQQIVMNLVINGAEAISDTGSVVVKTREEDLDDRFLEQCPAAAHIKPGKYVALEVTDSGTGMDPETMSKIFDPFFTTKFTGRGLGLAAVQGIVRSHNGALKVQSALGRGTTFTVFFPVEGSPDEVRPNVPGANIARGRGTVLVIDDETTIRDTAGRALRRIGYRALLASSGEEGVALLKAGSNNVVAVLLDLTMAGLSGSETFKRIKAFNPRLPVIISSGFNADEANGRFPNTGPLHFLQKPYTVQDLEQQIATALSEETETLAVKNAAGGI